MLQIIRKMQYDVYPPPQAKLKMMSTSNKWVTFNRTLVNSSLKYFLTLQHYFSSANFGATWNHLESNLYSGLDKSPSDATGGFLVQYGWFPVVRFESRERSIKVQASRRITKGRGLGICHILLGHWKLHDKFAESRCSAISLQLVTVSLNKK